MRRSTPIAARTRPRRRTRWSRWLLITIIAGMTAWLIHVNQVRVIGVGYIHADEALVTSEFTGKIVSLNVTCADTVTLGQILALVEDPFRTGKYREELAALTAAYHVRSIAHQTRLTKGDARLAAADRHVTMARAEAENAIALKAAVDEAWRRGESGLREYTNVDTRLNKALEGRAAAEALAARWRAELDRMKVEEAAQLEGFEKRLDAQRRLVELGEGNLIKAPFDGVITACPRVVGEMARPGVAIVRVQRNRGARILVWIPADELTRVSPGQPADVFLSESDQRFSGVVRSLPVEIGPLPRRLKRYFWQGQTWQQYAPLEIIPDDPDAIRLFGDARVDAVIHLAPLSASMSESFRPM